MEKIECLETLETDTEIISMRTIKDAYSLRLAKAVNDIANIKREGKSNYLYITILLERIMKINLSARILITEQSIVDDYNNDENISLIGYLKSYVEDLYFGLAIEAYSDEKVRLLLAKSCTQLLNFREVLLGALSNNESGFENKAFIK